MKNALILHGAGNNHSGNWFPWLKQELEKKGYKVWVPDLPEAEHPDREKWLQKVFSNPDLEFNSETVIVGHSAGATLVLLILEKLPEDIKIKKAILVAGYANMGRIQSAFKYKEGMLKEPFKWEKIKRSAENFYFFGSDNDLYDCGVDQAEVFKERLGGEVLFRKGQGHFNLENSEKYNQFPELLDII